MPGGDNGETLRDLIVRLIESAREYLRAEILVAKQTAIEWVERARPAIIFIAIAFLLALAASIVLLASLGMALAHWIGVAGGLAVASLLALGVAGLLVWLAYARIVGKGQ